MDAESTIRAELGPAESLLWAGRPRLGIVFRATDLFIIPITVLWLAFCGLGVFNVLVESPDPRGTAVPVVMLSFFFLVGASLGFGRFLIDRWLRARTVYGITSERILIVTHAIRRMVKSVCLDTLSDVTLTESATGSGTVTFGPIPPMYWYTSPGWSNWAWAPVPVFDLAEKTRQVYEIFRDARQTAMQTRTG